MTIFYVFSYCFVLVMYYMSVLQIKLNYIFPPSVRPLFTSLYSSCIFSLHNVWYTNYSSIYCFSPFIVFILKNLFILNIQYSSTFYLQYRILFLSYITFYLYIHLMNSILADFFPCILKSAKWKFLSALMKMSTLVF